MEKPQIIITGDGSHSFFLPSLNEHYHSRHGALRESQHVFIENGLGTLNQATVHILEMGFGTGLNALLSLIYGSTNNQSIHYTSIEPFPLTQEKIIALNYPELLEGADKLHFISMHEFDSGTSAITPEFILKKFKSDLAGWKPEGSYDIIYYDAFGPRVQPELWTKSSLEKITAPLKKGGIFVTYCAQGAFRRNLKELGLMVESLPGPPGKREMTRAQKPV